MSNSTVGFISPKPVTTTFSKKPKRKGHRIRVKNSSLRKKRPKKHHSNQKNNTFKLNYSKFNTGSVNIMSNWYWSNYKKAMEWQHRHQVAHWKATALALFEENRYLLQIINNMQRGMTSDASVFHPKSGKEGKLTNKNKKNPENVPWISTDEDYTDDEKHEAVEEEEEEEQEEQEQNWEESEDDFEIKMSEEMMEFFEQSYKRKLDQEKLKEKELLKSTEQEVEQKRVNKMKRTSEMSFLYGEGASMISGMETAVQLSFDKYCDSKSPKYWPNIPFRL